MAGEGAEVGQQHDAVVAGLVVAAVAADGVESFLQYFRSILRHNVGIQRIDYWYFFFTFCCY